MVGLSSGSHAPPDGPVAFLNISARCASMVPRRRVHALALVVAAAERRE